MENIECIRVKASETIRQKEINTACAAPQDLPILNRSLDGQNGFVVVKT